ncbi:MAG: hypothetical protein GTN76_16755 [Candidatus Aenigmarchaeota archaeon]|nr:hypothetical protein [Candidatus Aenigmarchaeota archaeon]
MPDRSDKNDVIAAVRRPTMTDCLIAAGSLSWWNNRMYHLKLKSLKLVGTFSNSDGSKEITSR